MEPRNEPETTDSRTRQDRARQDRAGVIPQADRRKHVRTTETPEDGVQIITDWASI